MRHPTRPLAPLILLLATWSPGSVRAEGPIEVEPAEIAKRRDLIGKEIVVDDRVKFFWPTPGVGYNEILLKRTDAVLVLSRDLIYSTSQSEKAVRARGILQRDGGRLIVNVTAKPELFANDVKRLKKVVASMAPDDAESRSAWGDWASRRASAFDDPELGAMAEALQAESIAAELRKSKSRTPEAILALARKARAKGVAEPEPSALAHLGFRLRSASARTAREFDKIAEQVGAFLPGARSAANALPSLPIDGYLKDPAGVYRREGPEGRSALDRRLWTDAVAGSLRLRAAADPKGLMALHEEAKAKIPDRKDVVGDLFGRASASVKVVDLRKSELLERARNYRENLKQPEKADEEIRAWLEYRIERLSTTNAEDRVTYAEDYVTLLKDKAAAANLLNAALKIDPASAPAVELFHRMGFVKTDGRWHDPRGPVALAPAGDAADRPIPKDDALLGLTPSEVKAQLGEPKRTSRIVTQGRISLQWVYEGARGSQYIDFVHRAGDDQPSVVSHYSSR